MNKLLDRGYWARALQNPAVLIGLGIDLLPIYAVLAWGWDATPLVLLYWLENVVIGAMTIPRIMISGAAFGAGGVIAGLFLSGFFVVHYGLFCFVHGTFLMAMSQAWDAPGPTSGIDDPISMIGLALQSGQHIAWIVGIGLAWQLVLLGWQFIWRGEWRQTNPMVEMMAPYGRIVVVHLGIFAGAFALFALGQPMIGVLALILFRAAYGVISKGGDPFIKVDQAMSADQRAELEHLLRTGKVRPQGAAAKDEA
jgi:hypothetical protein